MIDQCRQCKKYCEAADKVVKCQECSKCFHVSCANLNEKELGSVKGITSTSYFSAHIKNTTFRVMERKFLCSGDVLDLP